MNPLNCIDGRKNIGVSSCKKAPQLLKGFITTPKNFKIPEADASSLTAWQTALNADNPSERAYYFPIAVNSETQSEESIRESTPLATMAIRDGRYAWRFMFQEGFELHKAMFSHKNFSGNVYLVDIKDKVIGTSIKESSNTFFGGLTIDLLDTEKMTLSDGSGTATKTAVYLSLKDNEEIDVDGAMVDGKPFLKSLLRLTDAKLTINSSTSSAINVKVTNALDGTPVLGLGTGDFVLLDSSGATQTITSVTDNEDGTYVLAGTALTSGTLNLAKPSVLSIAGFEGIEVEVTIV